MKTLHAAVCAAALLNTACAGLLPQPFEGATTEFDGMTLDRNALWGGTIRGGSMVRGYVRNDTGRVVGSATVTIAAFGRTGSRIDTMFDTVYGLAPGETWEFEAYTLRDMYSYRVLSIRHD